MQNWKELYSILIIKSTQKRDSIPWFHVSDILACSHEATAYEYILFICIIIIYNLALSIAGEFLPFVSFYCSGLDRHLLYSVEKYMFQLWHMFSTKCYSIGGNKWHHIKGEVKFVGKHGIVYRNPYRSYILTY